MLYDTRTQLDRLGRALSSITDGGIGAPVDIHRDGDRYVIDVDLPGVDPGSIDLTVDGETLTIRAERSTEHTTEDAQWVVRERSSSAFVRRFTLAAIDPDRVEAGYHDGVLTVVVPVAEGGRRHKIPVSASGSLQALGGGGSDRRRKGPSSTFASILRRLPWNRHSDGSAASRVRGRIPVHRG